MREHSLGLAVAAILVLWLFLYVRGDPSTHLGAFYGNALADWLGTFVIVIATSTSMKSDLQRAGRHTLGRAVRWRGFSSIIR